MASFKRLPPALAAALLLAAMVWAGLRAALALTGGRLVYPLDDAYIHVAVARALAEHGVWGVTRYGFTSSTSSLAWPLLLAAGQAVFGSRDALPLVLNAAAALLCLAAGAWALRGQPPAWRLAVLLAMVVLTPLPTLVLIGMEHTLHVAAAIALAGLVARTVAAEVPPSLGWLAAAAALATSLRYESLFLIAASAAVLLFHRRLGAALAIVIAGMAPLAAYAWISVAHGWYPLPNSVLLKGARFDLTSAGGIVDLLGGRGLRLLGSNPHLLVLVIACLVLLALGRSPRTWPALAVVTTLLHLQLADTGWLYRYEAYLVALGLVAIGAAAPAALAGVPRPFGPVGLAATVALAAVVGYPLAERAVRAAVETPRASRNIFDQQYQMGLFLARYYPGGAVAANDIGAITAMADVRLLDLYGLASMDVARARRAGTLDRATVARLADAHGAAVIAVYKSWFGQSLPAEWLEAGSWRAPEKVVIADRVVTFYARDAAGRDRLAEYLRAFAPALPADVTVRLPGAPEAP